MFYPCIIKFLVFNLPVIDARSSSLTCPWTCIEITEVGIVTEKAYMIETMFIDAIDKVFRRENASATIMSESFMSSLLYRLKTPM